MDRTIEASFLCALCLLLSCCINVTASADNAVVRRMVVRLAGVPGLAARRNDVLFAPSARRAPGPPHALVYWGGDVQDYPEVMQSHRDNKNYLRWNLESTARVLSRNFPTKHIVIVRPSRIEYKSFSCYDNFVPSNNAGVPDHTPTHSALQHLHRLLQEVSNRIKAMPEAELLEALNSAALPEDIDIEDLHNSQAPRTASSLEESTDDPESLLTPTDGALWWAERLELHEAVLALAGFSKGCVVLNQLVYEIHYTHTLTPEDQQTLGFISRIEAMYWLDGGHAGGRNTWLTSRSLLETLTRLGVNIYIHVSPYQVQDEARPWIGREEKAFTAMLKKLGAKVHRYLHDGQGAPPSLHMHFDVVGNFKRLQDSSVASIPDSTDEDH